MSHVRDVLDTNATLPCLKDTYPTHQKWEKVQKVKKGREHTSNTWTQLSRTQVNYTISLFYLFSDTSDITKLHLHFVDTYMEILNIILLIFLFWELNQCLLANLWTKDKISSFP